MASKPKTSADTDENESIATPHSQAAASSSGSSNSGWAKFLHWWEAPTGRSSGLRIGLAMDSLRNSFSKKTGIFFGFTFDQWKKATLLDPTKVMSWN